MADDKASIDRIAAWVRKARLAKDLTQAQVAKRAGISENHYAQIERAEKNPSVSTFKNIVNAIGVSYELIAYTSRRYMTSS